MLEDLRRGSLAEYIRNNTHARGRGRNRNRNLDVDDDVDAPPYLNSRLGNSLRASY